MSVTGGPWTDTVFTNQADYSSVASTASEASLLGGSNEQPWLPAGFFDQQNRAAGKRISLYAAGVLSNTGTPTIIFQVRASATAGSSTLSGGSLGVSPTITTQSGVTNKRWSLELNLTCKTPGIGSGNTTLFGSGKVVCFGGFATPFAYDLEPTTPDTATWTMTLDNSVNQYFNLSVTWGTSSGSNTITCKELFVASWN